MEPATSNVVLIGPSLPILPKKMVQRIIAGEFVDFKDLLPAKSWLPAFRDNFFNFKKLKSRGNLF